MAQQDYARALLEFKNAANAMPRDAEPYYQIGMASLATGNGAGAVAGFKKATDLNPKHAAAQLKLSELMAFSRNKDLTQEAEKRLQQVLAAAPDNTEAIDTLALTELLLGRTDDAARRLEDALRRFPTHLQSSVALARLKMTRNDMDGAEEVLRKAAENAPKSADVALALGQFYLARQKTDLGEAEVRRALGLDPKNPSALLTLAVLQVNTNRTVEAEQTYKRISALADKRYRPLHAIFLFQQSKHEAALAEFEKLADEDPEDRTARTRLVATYAVLNRIPEAKRVLGQALRRNSKDQDALLQRSELYLRTGKIREAEEDLLQVLHYRPDSAEVHLGLAEVQRLQGKVKTQQQQLIEALRLNPNLLPARLTLARSYTSVHEAQQALALLDKTPEPQKNAAGVLIERNWALLVSGNSQEARSRIQEELKVARVAEVVLQDGLLKLDGKNYAGARADAEELLQKAPADVRAARLLTDTYIGQKQAAKAVERLRQLVSQRPLSAPLQTLLGQVLVSIESRAEARTAFEAAKRSAPQSFEPDLALARLDIAEKRLPDAQKRLTAVVMADPRNESALELLAEVETRAGNLPAAIASYGSVLQLNRSNVMALNNLAYLMATNNTDEALKLGQQALALAPDSSDAQDTLGWVYYRKSHYQIAIRYLKTAFEKEPSPIHQFHLGMAYLKAGDQERGKQMVLSAMQKDPNLPKTERDW